MRVLAKNSVLAMVSVTGGSRQIEIPSDKINLDFVLGNKVAFGSVNANSEYFESGVKDLSTAELQWPGWLKKLPKAQSRFIVVSQQSKPHNQQQQAHDGFVCLLFSAVSS
jgi:hypothetical protein